MHNKKWIENCGTIKLKELYNVTLSINVVGFSGWEPKNLIENTRISMKFFADKHYGGPQNFHWTILFFRNNPKFKIFHNLTKIDQYTCITQVIRLSMKLDHKHISIYLIMKAIILILLWTTIFHWPSLLYCIQKLEIFA